MCKVNNIKQIKNPILLNIEHLTPILDLENNSDIKKSSKFIIRYSLFDIYYSS